MMYDCSEMIRFFERSMKNIALAKIEYELKFINCELKMI